MLISALVSCKGNSQAATTAASVPETTNATTPDTSDKTLPEELFPTPESFVFEKIGNSLNFRISRPTKSRADSAEVAAAQKIAMYMSDLFGSTPKLETDWRKEEESDVFEIIFGSTDHPEVDAFLPTVSYGDYAIHAVGNKIIVISFSDQGYNSAVNKLKTLFKENFDSSTKKLTLTAEKINVSKSVQPLLSALPVYEGGRVFFSYDAGPVTTTSSCYEIGVKNTNPEEYGEYLKKLEAEGFAEYTSSTIANNSFATYTNSQYTVNVGYYAYDECARILIEPKGALPDRECDNKNDKITTSQITLLGVAPNDPDAQSGLAYLIRLENGKFIVIDGGTGTNDVYNQFEKAIFEQSSAYTETPVIAMWIITHSHGDHTGMLVTHYQKLNAKKIAVERIVMNQISTAEASKSAAYTEQIGGSNASHNYSLTEGKNQSAAVMGNVSLTFGAKLYKAHIGQAYYLSNCKIEVLYTLEGYAPTLCNAYNTTSVIMKMTFTDSASGKATTFLSTGDATGVAMQTLSNFFGSYISSDILSVCHHGTGTMGADGQVSDAYRKINAQLVLWPVGDLAYPKLSERSFNKTLSTVSNFKELYVSGLCPKLTIVPLPYVPGNVTVK